MLVYLLYMYECVTIKLRWDRPTSNKHDDVIDRYCPITTDDVTIECPDGSYSEANQSSCTVCPPGYECPTKVGDAR